MAQDHQNLISAIIRSIDKKIDWEVISAQNDLFRLTVRQAHGEASVDISRADLEAALQGGLARNKLRERIKRTRKRIFDARKPYMPWRLPKIEPIGAPGPRSSGWGPPRR
jgi:hypothetical protein